VELGELVLALVILLVAAVFFAAVGLLFSSLVRSTLAATILSYVVALLGTIGLPILLLLFGTMLVSVVFSVSSSTPSWLAEVITVYATVLLSSLSPISTAVVTEVFLLENDALFYFWQDISYASAPWHRIIVPSPWIIYVLIYLFFALLMLLIATLQVRRQARQ
jgi:hypothetical protein